MQKKIIILRIFDLAKLFMNKVKLFQVSSQEKKNIEKIILFYI